MRLIATLLGMLLAAPVAATDLVLTADDQVVDGGTYNTISGADVDNVTIKNVVVTNSGGKGIYCERCDGLRILDSEIGPMGTYDPDTLPWTEQKLAIHIEDSNDVEIGRNHLHDLDAQAIHFNWDDVLVQWNHGAWVHDNLIEDGFIGGIVIREQNDGVVVERNVIRHGAGQGIGLFFNVDNAIVRGNIIHDLEAGALRVLFNGIDINAGSQNGLLEYNTVIAVENACVTFEDATPGPSDGWVVQGNVLDSRDNTQVNRPDGLRWTIRAHPGVTYTDNGNVLRNWPESDINQDGAVGGPDWGIMLSQWGFEAP